MKTILIADDHRVMRRALSTMLDEEPDLEVVAQADDGIECVEKIKAFRPDLVILDLSMPGLTGLEVLERTAELNPSTRVLVLTMHDDDEYLKAVIAAGGAGYLHKSTSAEQLLDAIRAVLAGSVYLLPGQARLLAEAQSEDTEHSKDGGHRRLSMLSDREQEVFRLLALGHTNAEVAERLFISSKTVETYKARLSKKLGIKGRVALVSTALELGVLKRTDEEE
jgi:two-component system response regulator NreC